MFRRILIAPFDRRLVSQAVTNIVKNATEAIAAVPEDERGQAQISCCSTILIQII